MKKLILIAILFSSILAAQQKPETSGEIELVQEEKKVSSLDLTAAKGTAIFQALYDRTQKYQAGEFAKISTSDYPDMLGRIPTELLQYISIMYLNCIIEKGTCSDILDTILEFDIINSRLDNKVACPNMLLFWKAWLDNDMEKRHQHHSKITQVQQIDEFNRTKRKKYTKCKDTITNLLETNKEQDNEDFFKQRMTLTAPIAKTALEYMSTNQANATDIYANLEFK